MNAAGGDAQPLESVAQRTRIGLVAGGDTTAQIMRLLLRKAGYQIEPVLAATELANYWQRQEPPPDLWLIDASGDNTSGGNVSDDDADEPLASIAEHSDAPFLINEETAPLARPEALAEWRRRLLDKVDEIAAAVGKAALGTAPAPRMVWVLAASTGGPQAVHEFLAALPAGLPLALVYVQHIDAGFDATLLQALGRYHYPAQLCRGEQRLQPQQLLLVPADRQLRFLPFHRVLETRRPWAGRYRPAIDGVVAQLARMYQNRCGVIVFSGLCDDGALGCRVAQANGATVWVQRPQSCISPEMPLAVQATGTATFEGTPTELAAALAAHCARLPRAQEKP